MLSDYIFFSSVIIGSLSLDIPEEAAKKPLRRETEQGRRRSCPLLLSRRQKDSDLKGGHFRGRPDSPDGQKSFAGYRHQNHRSLRIIGTRLWSYSANIP